MTLKAGSLSHKLSQPSYYILLRDPEKALLDAAVQNKRITVEMIQESMKQILNSAMILQGVNPIDILELPKGMNKLELKMAHGGIDFDNIALMKDYDNSSLSMLVQWMHLHGTVEANKRYDHLRLVVQTECKEAYDSVESPRILYGNAMLQSVRLRLREKHLETKQLYSDCLYHHLLGFAGILTEECKIWWSEKFEIPKEEIV